MCMSLTPRRVVTGHDATGKAIVVTDQPINTAISMRAGQEAAVIWATDSLCPDLNNTEDGAQIPVATTHEGGTVFRVIRYDPGVSPRIHRTVSLDYGIVLSGEIDMEMDDIVITLRAGDFLIQRGTVHNWVNRSTEPCVIAFVLLSAQPVHIQGAPLAAMG